MYFAATGAWPLVHLSSFEFVTGPKTDHWLVQTFGVLILVVGAVFLMAAARDEDRTEMNILALSSALALSICDTVFMSQQVISRVYLLDAALELLFAVLWVMVFWRRGKV
jgi:hypothetical protein